MCIIWLVGDDKVRKRNEKARWNGHAISVIWGTHQRAGYFVVFPHNFSHKKQNKKKTNPAQDRANKNIQEWFVAFETPGFLILVFITASHHHESNWIFPSADWNSNIPITLEVTCSWQAAENRPWRKAGGHVGKGLIALDRPDGLRPGHFISQSRRSDLEMQKRFLIHSGSAPLRRPGDQRILWLVLWW